MTIGSNFEHITKLQFKVKALTSQVQSFETGEKYVSMCSKFEKLLSAKDREIANLKSNLNRARLEIRTVRTTWMQVIDDISDEHEKKLRKKDRDINTLKTQLLATQQQLDQTRDRLKEKSIELYQAKTEIEDQKGVNQKLKAQINRDYENSSIPSSQKPNRKKITNNREKTGRKPGGQPGHSGHHRKRQTPTTCILIPAPEKYIGNKDYKPTGKVVYKQVSNIGITMNVVEYGTPEFRNIRTGQRVHADFPDGVVNDINYGGSVKAFAFLLNSRCGVSMDKVSEILFDMTDGELQISKGMISGLTEEFSAKTSKEQKKAFADLLLSPVMNTDFTSAKVNGKNVQVAICATPATTLYFAREHKGHKGIVGTPVENYHGVLVHDHDTTYYSYGDDHQECLVHILRYLKGSMENEPNLKWNQSMWELLREMIHYRKSLPEENPKPASEVIKRFENQYDEILDLARTEYEYEPPSQYYIDGYNLYRRLIEYRNNHLLFLHDPRIPTNNNLCERKGRVFKRKQKQVMAFRSFDSLVHLCNSLSVIDILKASGNNLFKSVSAILC